MNLPSGAIPGHARPTVLVTGASGFVGRHVVRALTASGAEVVGTYRRERPPNVPSVRWVRWDSAEGEGPDVIGIDVVVHLAASTELRDWADGRALVESTVCSTARLLDCCLHAGVARFILASSGDAVGASDAFCEEFAPLAAPASLYAASKGSGELITLAYGSVMSTAVVRLFHPYGPGGERFLVNRMVRMVRDGKAITIDGRDGLLLNPVWATDAAAGVLLAATTQAGGVFNIAGPDITTLGRLVRTIAEEQGLPPRIELSGRAAQPGHVGLYARAQTELGYLPKTGLRVGLRRLVADSADSIEPLMAAERA